MFNVFIITAVEIENKSAVCWDLIASSCSKLRNLSQNIQENLWICLDLIFQYILWNNNNIWIRYLWSFIPFHGFRLWNHSLVIYQILHLCHNRDIFNLQIKYKQLREKYCIYYIIQVWWLYWNVNFENITEYSLNVPCLEIFS